MTATLTFNLSMELSISIGCSDSLPCGVMNMRSIAVFFVSLKLSKHILKLQFLYFIYRFRSRYFFLKPVDLI